MELIEFPFYFYLVRGPFPSIAESFKLPNLAARNATNIMTCVLLDLILLSLFMVFTAGFRRLICQADRTETNDGFLIPAQAPPGTLGFFALERMRKVSPFKNVHAVTGDMDAAQMPPPGVTYAVAAEGDPLAMAPATRKALAALDPTLPLDGWRPKRISCRSYDRPALGRRQSCRRCADCPAAGLRHGAWGGKPALRRASRQSCGL